jgi:hypothetical protein
VCRILFRILYSGSLVLVLVQFSIILVSLYHGRFLFLLEFCFIALVGRRYPGTETLKLVQERKENTLELIALGIDSLSRTQMTQQLRERIDKWDLMN